MDHDLHLQTQALRRPLTLRPSSGESLVAPIIATVKAQREHSDHQG